MTMISESQLDEFIKKTGLERNMAEEELKKRSFIKVLFPKFNKPEEIFATYYLHEGVFCHETIMIAYKRIEGIGQTDFELHAIYKREY